MTDARSHRAGPVVLACDLDGTLLDHDGSPVPGVREAVDELVRAGALFVVVTGRPLRGARRATQALGVEPVVYACYHGALVVEASGALIRHLPVPAAPGRGAVEEALRRGVGVTVWDVDEPRELEAGDDLGGEPGSTASRLVLHGDSDVVDALAGELRARWSGSLRVLPIRPGFAGVFAPRVDKGDALRLVAERLHVPMDRTAACGDATADESLLAAASVRIAVGEAPHVLGHLDEVVVSGWADLADALRARLTPLLVDPAAPRG